MNRPIQTESRKKNRGDRRQQSNGAQDEMQEILAGDANRVGNELPNNVDDSQGSVADALKEAGVSPSDTPEEREFKEGAAVALDAYSERRDALLHEKTNLDMGDGTIFHTGTLEDARARPSISAEALGRGEIVITRPPYTPPQSAESRLDRDPLNTVSSVTITKPPYVLGDGYVGPAVGTAVGPAVLPQVSTPVPQDIGILNPLEVSGATPPFIATIGEPLAETYKQLPAVKPQGDFFDFTKLPLPRLKVLVKRMPVSFTGDQHLLKLLMTDLYLSVYGLQRSFSINKAGSKFSHSQEASEIAYSFYDAPKRERSKLFETWGRLIDSHGVTAGTSFSAYFCSFDGEPTKEIQDVVDVWTAEIYPMGLTIDAIAHDKLDTRTQAGSVFGVTFGGTVARLLEVDYENVAKLLVEQ